MANPSDTKLEVVPKVDPVETVSTLVGLLRPIQKDVTEETLVSVVRELTQVNQYNGQLLAANTELKRIIQSLSNHLV